MIGLLALATAAVLPHLITPEPRYLGIFSRPAAFLRHFQVELEVVVSPTGAVEACKDVVSTGATHNSACDQIKAAQFTPATDRDGKAVESRVSISFDWPVSGSGGVVRPLITDLDLTVERLPAGAPLHPRVALALSVDAQGRVQGCDVAEASGAPALDAAACKAAAAQPPFEPVKDMWGRPTWVQSLVVGFGAYTKPIYPNGEYAPIGPPGPYYPVRAARMEVGGYALLACIADKTGVLTDCAVDEEGPVGFEFGSAALKMAQGKWMRVAPGAPGPVLLKVDFPRAVGVIPRG